MIDSDKEVEFIEDEGDEFPVQNSSIRRVVASSMAAWLIKTGIVKKESSANRILILLAISFFFLTFYIIFKYVL